MVDSALRLVKGQDTYEDTDFLYKPFVDMVCMLASIPFTKIFLAKYKTKIQNTEF